MLPTIGNFLERTMKSGQGFLTSQMLDKQSGFFVTKIALAIGFILNVVFQALYGSMPGAALGLSIIVLTIIIRTLMLPLGFNQQKSTRNMQKIQPKIEAIQKKYGDTKDPEAVRKRDSEIMAIQSASGASMLGGCLPLLITMPLFFALSLVMRTSYEYIPQTNELYEKISVTIHKIPNFGEVIYPIAKPMVPKELGGFDTKEVDNMKKLVNRFSDNAWQEIIFKAGPIQEELIELLGEKKKLESFLGMNLVEKPKLFVFPGFFIPILSGLTQFLSFFFMEKQTKTTGSEKKKDPSAMDPAMTQKMMKWTMPLMMVYFTSTVSAGVGLYWSISNVYSVLQQIIISKYYDKKDLGVEAPKLK